LRLGHDVHYPRFGRKPVAIRESYYIPRGLFASVSRDQGKAWLRDEEPSAKREDRRHRYGVRLNATEKPDGISLATDPKRNMRFSLQRRPEDARTMHGIDVRTSKLRMTSPLLPDGKLAIMQRQK
jgi:hypothetical protein